MMPCGSEDPSAVTSGCPWTRHLGPSWRETGNGEIGGMLTVSYTWFIDVYWGLIGG